MVSRLPVALKFPDYIDFLETLLGPPVPPLPLLSGPTDHPDPAHPPSTHTEAGSPSRVLQGPHCMCVGERAHWFS